MVPFTSILVSFLIAGITQVPADSLRKDTSGRWAAHLDNRYLLVGPDIINAWGGSIGRIWGPKKHEVTLGYYFFSPRGIRHYNYGIREQALLTGQTTYSYTYPRYIIAGYWHSLINARQWKVSIPIELGVGQAVIRQFALDASTAKLPDSRYTLLPVRAGGYVEWKVTRWVGLGLQTGYHWELRKHQAVRNLDGVYYRVRVLIYPAFYFEARDSIFKGKRLRSPFWPIK